MARHPSIAALLRIFLPKTFLAILLCHSESRSAWIRAEHILEKKIRVGRITPTVRLVLADTKRKLGKEDEADKLYREFLALRPKNIRALLNVANRAYAQGRLEECEELLLEAQRIKTNYAIEHFLGYLYEERGDLEKALQHSRIAASFPKAPISTLSQLGRVLLLLEKFDEARDVLDRAITAAPNDLYAIVAKANLMLRTEDYQAAERLFLRAKSIDPNDSGIQDGLDYIRNIQERSRN